MVTNSLTDYYKLCWGALADRHMHVQDALADQCDQEKADCTPSGVTTGKIVTVKEA